MSEEGWDIDGVWDKSLPDLGEKERENIELNGRGSVRLKKGLFYLNSEFEKRRKKIIAKKLP